MIALTKKELTAAKAGNDSNEVARIARDIRYWTAQRTTGQLVDATPSGVKVEFGSRVTRRADDCEQASRIVSPSDSTSRPGPARLASMQMPIVVCAREG